jgi:ABC-type polysaccharide/polyol phosphate export permease
MGKNWAGNFNSQILQRIANTPDLWTFLIVGDILATFFSALYWRSCYELWLESRYKTIWHFFTINNGIANLIIGKMLAVSIIALLYTIPIYINAYLIFGKTIHPLNILYVYLALILSIPAIIGLNFLLSSYTLLSQDITMIVTVYEEVSWIFSPIRYPVEIFKITKIISYFFPVTYALYLARTLCGLGFKLSFNFFLFFSLINLTFFVTGIFFLKKTILQIKKTGNIEF